MAKYEAEKSEILLGSNGVGKEKWIQEVDGELGKVVGAKELEAQISKLGTAGDFFDYASLFYQICLVFGAISLVMKSEKIQNVFFLFMIGLGIVAVGFSTKAMLIIA